MTRLPAGVTRVAPATAERWDAVWRGCPWATFFHSRVWAGAWEAALGGRYRSAALEVEFDDGKGAVVCASHRRRFLGLDAVAESSAMGTYGGWISLDTLAEKHAVALAYLLTSRARSLRWRVNPYDPLRGALAAAGDADTTCAIDLAPGFDEVFRSWTKGHRAAVAQSRREGIEVRPAATQEDWKAYYRVYMDTVERWGETATVVHPEVFFEYLAREGGDDVRLWLATFQGTIVAGALCLYAPRHVVYWHGAALAEHFAKRPVNLILHEAIGDACARGLDWFDFNPSGGHEGVMKFKKSFGATELAAPMVTREGTLGRLVRAMRGVRST